MRRLLSAVCLAVGFVLAAGCEPRNEADTEDFDGELIDSTTLPVPFKALFDPSNSVIPFPSNLLFTGSTDATLNIPVDDAADLSDPQVALNALDGFSTLAPMSVRFSAAVDPATVSGNVRLFQAATVAVPGSAAPFVVGITRELTNLAEFFATVSSTDATGATVAVLPLAPLAPRTTYLVAVTNGIRDMSANPAGRDTTYALARLPDISRLPEEQRTALEPLRQVVNAQDDALDAFEPGLASNVVLAWSFTTQSIGAVLAGSGGVKDKAGSDPAIASAINPTAVASTTDFGGIGAASIYAGTLTLPYYLEPPSVQNPTAPLSTFWKRADGGHLTGQTLGETNVPEKTGDQTVPLLVSIPNAGARPWPVVIYQHGITTNRTTLLAFADALASVGFAAVAIDLPLHGVTGNETNGTQAFRVPGSERHFDIDYVTQSGSSITAQAPDGVIDTSGRHFINLSSLLTSRDNLRQAVADLMALHQALGTMNYDGLDNGPDFDTDEVRFVGWSLGGMVGSAFLALENSVGAAVFPMIGGGIAKLLDGSPSFGPEIAAGLAANGVTKGTADYESFLGAAQTVVDSADPMNYAGVNTANYTTPGGVGGTTLDGARGTMLFEVVGNGSDNLPDQTIPNNVGTFALGFADAPAGTVPSPIAGTDPVIARMRLNQVSPGDLAGPTGASGETLPLLRFTAGYHGSIADPTFDPPEGGRVFSVMQNAMATFLAGGGAGFQVDPTSSGLDFASVMATAP